MAVVGDGRSGDPLHERDDKRDVYEGEVAMVDSVSELVRRVDRVVVIMLYHNIISYHIINTIDLTVIVIQVRYDIIFWISIKCETSSSVKR